jgi:flagellar hook protein FlgE
MGFLDDGTTSQIATNGVARFLNANGLLLIGDNVFRETPNSGAADLCTPQIDGRARSTAASSKPRTSIRSSSSPS